MKPVLVHNVSRLALSITNPILTSTFPSPHYPTYPFQSYPTSIPLYPSNLPRVKTFPATEPTFNTFTLGHTISSGSCWTSLNPWLECGPSPPPVLTFPSKLSYPKSFPNLHISFPTLSSPILSKLILLLFPLLFQPFQYCQSVLTSICDTSQYCQPVQLVQVAERVHH